LYFTILRTANRCSPIPVVQHAIPDSYLAVQSSTIRYTCINGFSPSSRVPQLTVCDGVNWSPTHLPGCDSKYIEKTSNDSFYTHRIQGGQKNAPFNIAKPLSFLN